MGVIKHRFGFGLIKRVINEDEHLRATKLKSRLTIRFALLR